MAAPGPRPAQSARLNPQMVTRLDQMANMMLGRTHPRYGKIVLNSNALAAISSIFMAKSNLAPPGPPPRPLPVDDHDRLE